jgi:hypothetical protein
MTIIDAIGDPQLFARWFKDRATWQPWLSFLAALFGLPMTAEQREIYRQCTGRDHAQKSSEAWIVAGRRGGKSFVLALVAVFLAAFHDYRPYLTPGERGMILIIATDKRQARVIFRYVRALLTLVPMLAKLVERETETTFDLRGSVSIEIQTANFRSIRGYTVVSALCDEIAFWPTTDDSSNPDTEILAALRPAMSTIPSAMLLCASSPYAKRGALYDAYRRYYGKDGPVLVWQATTLQMNPTIPASVIAEATERDPESARAEYQAQFRDDISSFIREELLNACIDAGEIERPRHKDFAYAAFCDPSGGSSDSMTLAIGHQEQALAVLDAVREVPAPFAPSEAVSEFAALLKSYGISRVTGDRYAGEWPREAFSLHGITYEPSEYNKSEIYQDFLARLNGREAALLDHSAMKRQFLALERRTARGGRDSIDHGPGGHDDICNAVAGCLTLALHVPGAATVPGFNRQVEYPAMGAV